MKKILHSALLWLRGVFFITTKIPYLIVLLAVGAFAFIINDQGMDLMIAFNVLDLFHPYVLSFLVLLIVWSTVLWYVARTTLSSANLGRIIRRHSSLKDSLQDPECGTNCVLKEDRRVVMIDLDYKRVIQLLAKWVPRVLSLLPYLIFIVGYTNVNGWNSAGMIKIVMTILIGTIHIIYLSYRTDIFVKGKWAMRRQINSSEEAAARFTLEEERSPREVIRSQHLRNTTILMGIIFVASFVYAWYTARSTPSLNGKPGLIILCGLIFYSLTGLIFIYISNRLKFPFFTLLLFIVLLISLPRNNNHALYRITDQQQLAQIDQRLADSVFFKEWLTYKIGHDQLFRKDSVTPLFLVAAEGGGIRACYWTSQVLKTLHILHPEFYRNTFAVTGASGGTVGLSFFYNYLFEKAATDLTRIGSPKFYEPLDTITGADYLSGVTYGFLFPDLVQRIIPWPVGSFDRAKFLGNGFSYAFAKHTWRDTAASTLLDESMLAPWQPATKPYERPVILFNSLYVEEGQKAVFAPYKLSSRYYEDAMDILDETKSLVPMKEAMLSSARFPAITPPGLMMRKTDDGYEKYGHLVDGGYFENTAVQTAQQTALMMKSVMKGMDLKGRKFVPVIVALSYGSDARLHKKSMGAAYEAAPLQGGINTLFRWIDGANAIAVKLDPDLMPIDFKLIRYKGDRIPLGWYISENSRKLIEKYASRDRVEFRKPYALLKKYLN